MIEEFLEELVDIKDNFDWCVNTSGMIRGRLKKDVCDKACCASNFCPITAIYRIKEGLTISPHDATSIDDDLSENDKVQIINAADHGYDSFYVNELRHKILSILGL